MVPKPVLIQQEAAAHTDRAAASVFSERLVKFILVTSFDFDFDLWNSSFLF